METRFGLVQLADGIRFAAEPVTPTTGKHRGQRVMSFAFYSNVGGEWRLFGRRVLLSRRQIRGRVQAWRELLDVDRLLAFLENNFDFYRGTSMPCSVSIEAWKVLAHLRGLKEPATREDVRLAIHMKTSSVVAALRELEKAGLAASTGGAEFVDDSTSRRERRRRGVKKNALRW